MVYVPSGQPPVRLQDLIESYQGEYPEVMGIAPVVVGNFVGSAASASAPLPIAGW